MKMAYVWPNLQIEEDLEALNRTGVKNQSHTLRLSRTVVRAKGRKAQIALLRLLRDADLPCRRLFLDYRGLRLLAPWCTDAPLDFKYVVFWKFFWELHIDRFTNNDVQLLNHYMQSITDILYLFQIDWCSYCL